MNLYNFIFDSLEKQHQFFAHPVLHLDLSSLAYVAPLSAHRKQGGMQVSEVGCVTIATSWVIGRTVPLWWYTQGVGSRCSHWAVRAVLLFLLLGWRKLPCDWDKEMQRPWIWVDGDEEGEGWKGWSWRLHFVCNLCCPICCVIFFLHNLCEVQGTL